jgi:hypothetical protein
MMALRQLSHIDFNVALSEPLDLNHQEQVVFDFRRLAELNPLEVDNRLGLCPFPLYELNANEIDALKGGANLDEVRGVLKNHDILQYFFPAPDQLAIGLVDRGSRSTSELLKQLELTPKLGHPFGTTAVADQDLKLPEIIEFLQHRRLLVEGELGLEVSSSGKTIRQSIKFRPQESLISKVIHRFTFKVDIKSIIGGLTGR